MLDSDVATCLRPIHIEPFRSNNATDNDNLSAEEPANRVVCSGPFVGQIRCGLMMSTVPRSVGDPAIGTPAFEPPVPQLDLITRFTVELASVPWQLGRTTDLGNRRIIPITGGHFRGPLLNGEILNNGADWQVVGADGATTVDTRYLLKTHDNSLIYLRTFGFRHGPPKVLAELADGRIVDPDRYYFRIHLSFETAADNYMWLNNTIAVGSAIRLPQAVVYDAYAIK